MTSVGRIGGLMVAGSSGLLLVTGAIAATGHSVGVGTRDAGGLVLAAAVGLGALGAGALGLGGPDPLRGRWLRISLVTLTMGLIALTGSAAIAATMTYDPLESAPVVLLTLFGGWASFISGISTVAILLRSGGRSRSVGALFIGGLTLAVVGGVFATEVFPAATTEAAAPRELATLLEVGGLGVMLAAWAGLGVMVLGAAPTEPAGQS